MRILITGCESHAGQALGRQLAGSSHTVIGADIATSRSNLFAATAKVPAAADPSMLPALRRLLKEYEIDLLIPTVSDELPLVASASSSLLTHASVVIGGGSAVSIAHDKYLTMANLASRSVPVPRFALPSDFATTSQALDHMDGPLVIKPRIAAGGRDVQVIERAEDISWPVLDDSFIVQEFASGIEYAPMVYRPRTDYAAPFVVVVEKIALKEGRVGNAMAVRRLAGMEATEVMRIALQATEALGLVGPADIDIRCKADGSPVVLEVNARFGANSEQAPELLQAVLAEYGRSAISEAV